VVERVDNQRMDLQAVEGKYHVHHHHRHHHHHDLTTAPTCHRLCQVEMMDHQWMDLQAVEGKDHVHRHHDLTTAPTCHHTTTQNQTGQESHLLLELHFVTKVPDYRLTMALQAVEDIHLLRLRIRLLALVMVLRRGMTETHKDADYTLVSFSKKLPALATGRHL
jgi:hypothetical protein